MKSSMLVAASGALLAVASPLAALDKRMYETEIVTEWTTVYVTEGVTATMFGPGAHQRPTPPAETPTPEPEPTTPPPEPTTTAPPPPPEPVAAHESHETRPPPPPPPPKVTSTYKAPPPPPPPPSSTKKAEQPAPSDYASTAVYHHNIHRSNHSAPSISWSDKHASYAAESARKCVFKHDLGPGGGGYGQNLAMWGGSNAKSLGSSKAAAQGITNMWYNGELNKYPSSAYGKGSPDMSDFSGWGHFSQLVWAGSEQVGCHTQYCEPGTMSSMGSWFTVCNYYPAGNVGGRYGDNVHPPLGSSGITA